MPPHGGRLLPGANLGGSSNPLVSFGSYVGAVGENTGTELKLGADGSTTRGSTIQQALGRDGMRDILVLTLESLYRDRFKPMGHYVEGRLRGFSSTEGVVLQRVGRQGSGELGQVDGDAFSDSVTRTSNPARLVSSRGTAAA